MERKEMARSPNKIPSFGKNTQQSFAYGKKGHGKIIQQYWIIW